jgi:putative peptide zinc metalloprotease protein
MSTTGVATSGDVLCRADGVRLIGEMQGSGYRVPPALVRRGDGQTIQLTSLLYLTLEAVDGRRSVDEVAQEVTGRYGKPVSPANVSSLVEEQLRPLGLLTRADGSQPEVRRSNPLLGLRFRFAVTDPERTRRLTAPFMFLFRPFLVVPLMVAFGAICWWVFFEKGLAAATYQAFQNPGLLMLVLAVTVLSAGFHEFGHAAAARYGGATPGVMGGGVYLVWPAFYTDVTDAYRLGRAGRVRTDLGGLYFNAIVAVAITGCWLATGYDALLLVVATQILQMVRQLTPLVRFDGYHLLADLTGVPDLFHRIKPTLLGVLPWRWGDPEARALKTWARAVVTLWVAVVVPVLLFTLAMMVIAMPRVLATAWAKLQAEQQLLGSDWTDGHTLEVFARVVAMVAVAFPIVGTFVILTRTLRRVVTGVWRGTRGRPGRRAVAGALGLAIVAGLAWAWWPHPGTYRPIQPGERGTLVDAFGAARAAPAAASTLRTGASHTSTAVWDKRDPLPTKAHPTLAVVLVPTGSTGHAWVFPFDKPLAPGPGDNQALAVNTADGTVKYSVAFALVWADPNQPATNTNGAYAFASCKSCAAVAIAFQVVFVVGNDPVVAPENLAGALTSNCVNCLTYALAQQLFVTLDGPLSPAAKAKLDKLWAQIAAYGANIENVPLSQIAAQLDSYESQILAIVEADQPGTVPSPAASATSAASSTPTATASPSASPTATASSSSEASPTESPSASPSDSPSPSTSPSG